jgi:Zn-dependent protease with chaperone function
MDILVVIPLVFIWAVLPQVAAIITHWLSGFFSEVLFKLPFSRTLEVEADLIGLQLTAKVVTSRTYVAITSLSTLILPWMVIVTHSLPNGSYIYGAW